ncbi:MAG: hypothetical protein ABR498_04095 [Candidatus Dormibacteria bacterium]
MTNADVVGDRNGARDSARPVARTVVLVRDGRCSTFDLRRLRVDRMDGAGVTAETAIL